MPAKILLAAALVFAAGCSTVQRPDSLSMMDHIAVQRLPATEVSIERIEEGDRYDFYISLLDDSGNPSKTFIAKGFRETARAQFHNHLNSVIIRDHDRALYALVVDKAVEYRFRPQKSP